MRRLIFLLIFALFTVVFFLPKMATGGFAKKQMIARIEKNLGGKITIDNLHLSWTDRQSCKQLQWNDHRNNITLSANSLIVPEHLINCLRYNDRPLKVLVEGASIKCEPKGKFLKSKQKYRQLNIKFAPFVATVQKGHVSFDKTEIDVTDSLRVAIWGSLDLNKNHMDITLQLSPKALEKMFKIKNLPANYLLDIPISCKMSTKALEKHLLAFLLKNYAKVTSSQR